VVGSYAGSALALQAKPWIYEIGSYAGNAVIQAKSWVFGGWNIGNTSKKKEHNSSTFQEDLVSTITALKEAQLKTDTKIKELEVKLTSVRDTH
jgi:flagellar hook-basal body complex protein FliE